MIYTVPKTIKNQGALLSTGNVNGDL